MIEKIKNNPKYCLDSEELDKILYLLRNEYKVSRQNIVWIEKDYPNNYNNEMILKYVKN